MIDALTEIHLLESAVKLNLIEDLKMTVIRDYYEALFDTKPYTYKEFKKGYLFYKKPKPNRGFWTLF